MGTSMGVRRTVDFGLVFPLLRSNDGLGLLGTGEEVGDVSVPR